MPFTRESGTRANRIYERLRKRSWRLKQTAWWWGQNEHQAYVEGVRDGIKGVTRET